MRVLGIGEQCDLGDLYLRLQLRGHDVRVHISDPDSKDVLEGLVSRASPAWRDDLEWVGSNGLVLFEGVGHGDQQDALRRDGFRVVGGSAVGDRLEMDRAYGQRVLREVGLKTAAVREFDGFEDAVGFLRRHPRRYVLKYSGSGFASTRTYVGVLDDGEDMLAVLRLHQARWRLPEVPRLILMDHVKGIEVGVGAFFDGKGFLTPANLDWEHKRFFPGDLGELTGEMGTLVTYRGGERLFDATLARLAPLLREARHVGYVNLNLMANDEGAWPLEFTCRFGYPGFAILSALHATPWDELLKQLCDGDGQLETHSGMAVGIVLTVPPFPYTDGYERLSKGSPVFFRDLDDAERDALHYGEVRMESGQLVTAGQIGYVMVVTARGQTVREARERALERAAKVIVPNVRYRTDIGESFERSGCKELMRFGWLR